MCDDAVWGRGRCPSIAAIGLVTVFCAAASSGGEPGSSAPKNGPVFRFEDVTAKAGLTGLAGSQAAWGDYNNDGWVDLYVAGKLWRNESGKRFTRVAKQALSGMGLWGDYDNDGFRDLYCWSGGGRLYRNVRGQRLVEAGRLPDPPMKVSRGAVWGDFDGDGFLDLYVGGYESPGYDPDAVYSNDRKGGFKLASKTPGRAMPARGVTAADYDEDGDLDVYVSNYRLAPNLLLQNDGKGRFADVAARLGVAGDGGLGAWGHTIGSAWGDLDSDGHLDLFVGNFSHRPAYQDRPKFYRNLGPKADYRFEDKSSGAGLAWQESFASPALGDFDNDGLPDLFFSTVYGRDHCVLYRNNGNWTFADVTARVGISSRLTYQATWADFDNDGDLDLLAGGRLYRNGQRGTHWLKVRLAGDGRRVNRDAVGAQVRINLGGRTMTRQVETGTGEGNQSDSALHFGLGAHRRAVTLVISWPDGSTQQLKARPDRSITVRYTRVPRRPGRERATAPSTLPVIGQ